MRRYLALALLYTINTVLLGTLGRVVSKAHRLFHKPFIFKTPFGTFLGSTVNHWTVLIPDYEPEVQAVIKNNIKKTKNNERKTFLSIGTHIGRYAIELAKNHDYEVYCFEPSPATFRTLKINTILSEVEEKTYLYNCCLGEHDGETLFEYIAENDASSKMVKSNELASHEKFISVPVKRYDGMHLAIKPDLIVMDVE